MSERHLTPLEEEAWIAVTRSVRRTSPRNPPEAPTKSARTGDEKPSPKLRETTPQSAREPGPSGQRTPTAGVADRGKERKVRRGQVPFDARLDLHGHTQASADAILRRFIAHQSQAGVRCVLVITGKGRDGQAVLKRNFLHWIDSPSGRAVVSGVAEAHPRHGGSGAFYVWLRRRDRQG